MEDNTIPATANPPGILASALHYAARGWHVFPAFVVWNEVTGKKEPRFPPSWAGVSTTDPEMITAWFGPGGLYGERGHLCIDCGKSGLVVIDPDAAGLANWAAFRAFHRDVPETYRVATPGGGEHWFYRARPGEPVTIDSSGKIATGVDVRGTGGLVFAPPSRDARGRYRWLEGEPESNADLPFVPRSVIEAVTTKGITGQAGASGVLGAGGAGIESGIPGLAGVPRLFTPEQAWHFLSAPLRAFGDLDPAREGQGRNARLFELALTFSHFLGTYVSAAQARELILAECQRNGMTARHTAHSIEATIASAWARPIGWRAQLPPDPGIGVIAGGPGGPQSLPAEPGENLLPALPAMELNRALTLPPAFWEARPVFAHIRQMAHARLCSPDVALHAVLARLAACHPHAERIDTGVGGGPMSLNYFAAVTGPPSAGKTSSVSLARILLPGPPEGAGTGFSDGLPLGSGEGLAESFMGSVEPEPDAEGRKSRAKAIRKQVRHNAFMYVDEGEAIVALMARSGATIGETLRRAWSGATLGQSNANTETTRVVREGTYAIGLVIGFQPAVTWPILRDTAGTPQRFMWVWAAEADVPQDEPEDPGALSWSPRRRSGPENPLAGLGGVTGAWSGPDWREPEPLTLDPAIRARIRAAARLARMGAEIPALDTKRDEMCVRIAALFALLDGRGNVTEEDWALAGMAWEVSCRVRDHLISLAQAEEASVAAGRARSAAAMAGAAEEARLTVHAAKRELALVRVWAGVGRKLAGGARIRRVVLRKAFSGDDKPLFDIAVTAALERGDLIEDAGELRLPG